MKAIKTRKNEKRITTRDPREMLGMFLAKRLERGWKEDFVDESDGRVVTITRNETIVLEGMVIDHDVLAQIQFHMEAGDIESVEVSNQRREAVYTRSGLSPWLVTASIGGKNKKLLLHANSIEMAVEVAKDYIELNYTQFFTFVAAKDFGNCIIINPELPADEEQEQFEKEIVASEETAEKKYYKLDISLSYDETGGNYTFVVYTTDVDSAKEIVTDYLYNIVMKARAKENNDTEPEDFKTTIQAATPIPCNVIIEKEFSLAYVEEVEA
jgi:hypothetical protein